MTPQPITDAVAIGVEIAQAEIAAQKAKDAARDARAEAKDQTRRMGAYVALGKAIVRCMLLQVRDDDVKVLILATRHAAMSELESSGLSSAVVTSRMNAIDKGISRARVSAEERVSGRTKAGRVITVPAITAEADYLSTETEADRQGRANAEARKSSTPELAVRLAALNAIAEDVRTIPIDAPDFRTKLHLLLAEVEKLAIKKSQ